MVTVVDGGGGGGIFPDFNPMKTPPKTESKNGPSLKTNQKTAHSL